MLAFIGTFGRSYDLGTVVEAARLLPERIATHVRIVIAGDGPERAALERQAFGLAHVEFVGWLARDEAAALLSSAAAGLAAYAAGALQSIPNKIIDYLSFACPIINGLKASAPTC